MPLADVLQCFKDLPRLRAITEFLDINNKRTCHKIARFLLAIEERLREMYTCGSDADMHG